MEGVSHEASSFAGHYKFGKLIGFYDDNKITIDGSTDLTFTDDTALRFKGYGWQVLHLQDVNDLDAIDEVIAEAKGETRKPTLVITRTHIGYGSPNRQDTSKAHGEPLGVEEIRLTKQNLGWPSQDPFFVPQEALDHCRRARERGETLQHEWQQRWAAYRAAFPTDAAELDRRLSGTLPDGWQKALPNFTADNGAVASRAASGVVLNALAKVIPELMGGSADLAPSNNTLLKDVDTFTPETPGGRNMHFGIREHGMASIMNGMSLHGGVIPYGGTFLVFSDYMRPPIRLASFMHRRVIYVFTHDSIGLGEDGPTHQPIEQLAALRVIPRMTVIRPADASETVEAWRAALLNHDGPTALVLTRQKLGFIDRTKFAPASGAMKGGYVLADAKGAPKVVLLSSGSEVALALAAWERLTAEGLAVRVVSMPSHEMFARQPESYREDVLGRGARRVAIEAAHPMPRYRWVGSTGEVIGLDRYGASAPYQRIYTELGLTVDHIVDTAKRLAT
jgi:transketolase